MALLREPSGGGAGDPESRESTWKVMRLSITQDSQREAGRGWGHRLPQGGRRVHSGSTHLCRAAKKPVTSPRSLCPPETRGAGLTPSPTLEAWGRRSPPDSAAWKGPCCLLGYHPPCLPLGRRGRWTHSPNMQKRREDGFLSGKHRQEGSPSFLSVLPVPTKVGSEIIRMSDLAGLR